MLYYVYFLKNIPDTADLVTQFDGVLQKAASSLGLQFAYRDASDNQRGVVIHAWVELLDAMLSVRLAVDEVLPARYLEIGGVDQDSCDDLVRELGKGLSFASVADLLHAAQHADDDPGALQRLGMGLNRIYNQEARELLVRGLSSENIEIRYNAAMGASFVRWHDLVEALAASRRAEKDDGIQRVLDFAAQMCGA